MRRFMDAVIDLPILENAYQRKVLMGELISKSAPLAIHIGKLLVAEANDTLKDHWRKECKAFLSTIVGVPTKNNKYLRKDDYKKALFDGRFDPPETADTHIRRMVKAIQLASPDQKLKPDVDTKAVYDRISSFYGEICEALARGDAGAISASIDRL